MAITSQTRKTVSIFVSICFFVAIIFYFYKNLDDLKKLNEIKLIYIVPLIIINITYIYLNGLFSKIICEPFNIELKEHFLLAIASSFVNLIAPFRAGVGLRAVYMKRKYGLGYLLFSASVFGNYIIIILISSIIALFLMGIIYVRYKIFNFAVTSIFSCLFVVSIMAISSKLTFKNKIIDRINNGWNVIKSYPGTIFKLILNTLIGVIVYSLNVFLIFESLDLKIGITAAIYFTIMNVLSSFINLTPGSFGITEGLFLISANILGISPTISLLVALISRVIGTFVLLILGPLANYKLFKKIQD